MKNSSSLIIGVSIIIGFTILGLFQMNTVEKDSKVTSNHNENRYELVPANDNNIIIFDKKSGEYWNKFIAGDEGPTNWEKGDSPIHNQDQ